MPDSVLTSELLILTAKWVGITSLVLVFLLSVILFSLRFYFSKTEARANRVRSIWQQVFMECFDKAPLALPELEDKDMVTVLVLWNYFNETFRDQARENLRDVALRIGADSWSFEALNGNIRRRLLAIQTLGWLKDDRAWFQMLEIMHDSDPVTSLCAAKALLKINPAFGIEYFVPMVAERKELNYATVGKLLRECGAEIVTEPMIEEIRMRKGVELTRILRYARLAYEERTAPVIRKLLDESDDIEVIIECLRAVDDPRELDAVRKMLKHEDWRVRTQAAICLGRVGTIEDTDRLIHAAGDQHWWVRFRSATALANLPEMTADRLANIAAEHQNLFGTDIVNKVRLEKEAYQ